MNKNVWNVYSNEIVSWCIKLPPIKTYMYINKYIDFIANLIELGEKYRILRQDNRLSEGYNIDKNVSVRKTLRSVFDTHNILPLTLSRINHTKIAFFDRDNLIEADITSINPVLEKVMAKKFNPLRNETKNILEYFADDLDFTHSDTWNYEVMIWIETYSDIWFPVVQNNSLCTLDELQEKNSKYDTWKDVITSDELPEMIDYQSGELLLGVFKNRTAYHHTPRFNSFLSDVSKITHQLNGELTFEVENIFTNGFTYADQITDEGLIILPEVQDNSGE